MSRFFQAILTGIFFTFFMDFFIFLGIKVNYIDFFEIKEYYNILFADNQNIYIFSFFTILFGFVTIYLKSSYIKVGIVGIFFLLSLSTLIQDIGYRVGEFMFMKKDVVLKDKRHTFIGDIRYIARDRVIFYDYELKKQITLDKDILN